MSEYTKGEWKICPRKYEFKIKLGGHKSCSVSVAHGSDAANIPYYGTREEAEANAHLIAAAPDLYEALEGIAGAFLDYVERDMGRELKNGDLPHQWHRARAVLMKARGEEI